MKFEYIPTEPRILTDYKNKLHSDFYAGFLTGYRHLLENDQISATVQEFYDNILVMEPRREMNRELYDMAAEMAESIVDGLRIVMKSFHVIEMSGSPGVPIPSAVAPDPIQFGPMGPPLP
jgi:hypothetical protein